MANGNHNSNGHHRNGTGNGLVHSPPRTGYGVNGNGHRPEAAIVSKHDLLWDGLPPAVTGALGQPLDPALVSQRKGRAGRTFSYIEGHVAISEANRVFGFGGWGHELVTDVTLREIENVDPHTGEVKLIRAYSAPVRVTVPGAPPRTDVGYHAVTEETADGHETALKGAVTDGLKRALRSFGDRFGNGLSGDRQAAGAARRAPSAYRCRRTSGATGDGEPPRLGGARTACRERAFQGTTTTGPTCSTCESGSSSWALNRALTRTRCEPPSRKDWARTSTT